MAVTQVCCTCLSFDVEMLSLTDAGIRKCLEKVINMKIELEDELLQNVCTECVLVMRKFVKFRDKCCNAYQRLSQIISQSTHISETLLKAESMKLCSETIVFNNFTISNNILTIQDPNFDNVTKTSDVKFENTSDIFESQTNSNIDSFEYVKHEYSPQHVAISDHYDSGTEDDLSPINNVLIKSIDFEEELLPVSVREDKEDLNIVKSPQRNEFVSPAKKKSVKRKQALWKSDYAVQITLSKDQQREELFKREMSDNYVNAPFKCSDCVTGFKSKEKVDRHMDLHDESRGALQCDICKLRYCDLHRLRVHQKAHKLRYKCLTCEEITNTQRQALRHQKRHRGIVFKCKVCDTRFKQEVLYRRHIRTTHATDYVCDLCGDYFTSQVHLTSHKNARTDCRKSPTNVFECKMCDEQFLTLNSWYSHMLKHAKDKEQTPPTECQICGHKTTTWNDWSFHYCSEHRNKNVAKNKNVKKKRPIFICDVCGKTLTHKLSLATHILIQHTEKKGDSPNPKFDWQDACEICNKNILRCNMRRHMRTHTGEKPYACDVCGKCFTRASTRMEHAQSHKTKDENSCPHRRNRHRKSLEGEKPFSCQLCQRSFTSKRSLGVHQMIHTGEKPFSCDVCQRYFSSKRCLKVHQMIHTGEKPFSCDFCKRSFISKQSLEIHRKIHTGEKFFSCDICQRNFTTKQNLQSHRKTHTGEKPYACDICNKCFNHKSNLLRHGQVHTDTRKWVCDICGGAFTQAYSLKLHTNTVHLKLPHPPRKPRKKK